MRSQTSPPKEEKSVVSGMDGSGGDIRRRRRLAPHETEFLTRIFEQYPRPNGPMREMIAKRLGMSVRGVQIWFQNKRAKVRRDMLESGRAMLLFSPTIPLSGGTLYSEINLSLPSENMSLLPPQTPPLSSSDWSISGTGSPLTQDCHLFDGTGSPLTQDCHLSNCMSPPSFVTGEVESLLDHLFPSSKTEFLGHADFEDFLI